MSIFESIPKALNLPFYDFGIVNDILTCNEGVDVPTSTDTPHLVSYLISAPVNQGDLGISEFREGIYQIDINYAEGSGMPVFNKMADKLNEVFNTGAHFEHGGVCIGIESVSITRMKTGGGWSTVSLNIDWNSYTARI